MYHDLDTLAHGIRRWRDLRARRWVLRLLSALRALARPARRRNQTWGDEMTDTERIDWMEKTARVAEYPELKKTIFHTRCIRWASSGNETRSLREAIDQEAHGG